MATVYVMANGQPHRCKSEPDDLMFYAPRNQLDLNGPKFGYGLAGAKHARC